MSALRVLWCDDEAHLGGVAVEEPAILPFSNRVRANGRPNVVERARILYMNRSCPDCSYPVVDPIELDDGLINHKGMTIPGSATLVGFRCRGCRSEWSAQ